MSNSISFNCWKCGAVAENIPLPLPRAEMCQDCRADLHVCGQCEFYDTSKASACREPVADHVGDKTRANFCGYLTIKTGITQETGLKRSEEQALEDLFGVNALDSVTPSTNDQAKSALDDLFGLESEGNKSK